MPQDQSPSEPDPQQPDHQSGRTKLPGTNDRSLIEAISQAFCLLEILQDDAGKTGDLRILDANPAFAKHTGLTEVVGRTGRELFPDLESCWNERFARVASTRQPEKFTLECRCLKRWFEIDAFPCGDPEQRQVGVLFADATEWRDIHEALRRRENILESFYDNSPFMMGVVEIRENQIVPVHANRGVAQFMGSSPEELTRHGAQQVEQPKEVDRIWLRHYRLAREKGEAVKFQYPHPTAGGEVWISATVSFLELGPQGDPRFSFIAEDVSAQKAVEARQEKLHAEANEARLRFEAVVDNSPVGICVWRGPDLVYEVANPAHRAIAPEKSFLGKTFAETWPEALDQFLPIIQSVYHTGRPYHATDVPARIRQGPDGSLEERFFDVTYVRLPMNSSGHPAVLLLTVEVTERHRVNAALEKAKKSAEEASRAKSEFLANMSHEIRTPMTGVVSALELLLQLEEDPEHAQLLKMADDSARHLRQLISDILDFSQIEAGKVTLSETLIDPAAHLEETASIFLLEAHKKGVRLDWSVSEEVPSAVLGDPARIRQVLINLVGNAIKFTEEGEVSISIGLAGNELRFVVSDTGIGIPKAQRHLLFESFSQLDAGFDRSYGGSGLGLAISRRLVELMGGRIGMEDRPDGGSIFFFTVPLRVAAAGRSIEGSGHGAQEASGSDLRILLAEDDANIRGMLTFALKKRGWQVVAAASGQAALDLYLQEDFEAILMDLQIPVMNGLEATRAIREASSTARAPVCIIGLTAHAQRQIIDECLQVGMDAVLTKPFEMNDLYAAIETCLADRCEV